MKNLQLLILPILLFLNQAVWATPVKILPLGDSITDGAGYNPPYSSYRDELYDLLTDAGYDFEFVGTQSSDYDGVTLHHDGVPSIRADQIYNGGTVNGYYKPSLQTKLSNYDVDIVLLHAGTNDIVQGQGSNSTTLSDIENIIDELQTKNLNIIILVARIIPIYDPDMATSFNNLLTNNWADNQSTNDSSVIIIDQHTGITSSDLYSDLVHPIQSGETKMANQWLYALEDLDILSDQLLLDANLELSSDETVVVENSTVSVSATSDSNADIIYSSTTLNICTVNNSLVTTLNVGICSIKGQQDADGNYKSDTAVINITVLSKSDQAITVNTSTSSTNIGSIFTLGATSTSGLTTFTYLSITPSVCSLNGFSVTALSEGDCKLTASHSGDSNYNAATSAIKVVPISKNEQTITLVTPASVKLGTSFEINANASSSLTVEIISETPDICTVSANEAKPLTAGDCKLTAKQSGNESFKPQTTQKTITITEPETSSGGGSLSPLSLFSLLLVSLIARRRTS